MNNDYSLLNPQVSNEDVEQEAELLKLEYDRNPLRGTPNPSKRVIRMKLEGRNSAMSFGEQPKGSTPVQPYDVREDRLKAIGELLQFAEESGDTEIEGIIHEFLLEPDEHNLVITINRLSKFGVISETYEEIKMSTVEQPSSLADLLRRQLQSEGSMTYDELYEIAQMNHNSNRPRAAVRQTIRRFKDSGEVTVSDKIVTYAKEINNA